MLAPVLLLMLYGAPPITQAAPVLSMGNVVNYPCVQVAVSLGNDTPSVSYDPLAGIQFDLMYDTQQFTVSTWGAGGAAAQQRLDVNGSYQTGGVRVLFTPNSSTTVSEGTLFTINFCRTAGAVGKTYADFSLSALVLGNGVGDYVNSSAPGTTRVTWGSDFDGDGTPDSWDLDDDNDGMTDEYELRYGLNPYNAADAAIHSDGDGLTNLQ
ncbi:MAG: hypothetical protein FD130_1113, partial [Halothiobacillaceae bacterium]